MAHRHLIGFTIGFIGIIFLVVGATAFEHRILTISQDSIMIRVFDQDLNAPMIFLGITLIIIGTIMWFKEKKDCRICNHRKR